MLGSNPGLLRLRRWQSDAQTTKLVSSTTSPVLGHIVYAEFALISIYCSHAQRTIQYFWQKKPVRGGWPRHIVVAGGIFCTRYVLLTIYSAVLNLTPSYSHSQLTNKHPGGWDADCSAFICWLSNILIKWGMLTISVVNFWLFSVSCWLVISHIPCGWTADNTKSFNVKMLTIQHPLNVKSWVCNVSCWLSQLLCGCWVSSISCSELLTIQHPLRWYADIQLLLREECWVISVPGGSDAEYPSILVG